MRRPVSAIDLTGVLVQMMLLFAFAFLGGEVARRLKQPSVVGQLLAGVVLGPAVFAIVDINTEFFQVLAELGVILLLFDVGLETRLEDLRKVGGRATLVAVLGVILPFVVGGGLAYLFYGDTIEAMFIGTALVATSIGITAAVLDELGVLHSQEAKIVIAAAVIDDILALTVLSGVQAFANLGRVSLDSVTTVIFSLVVLVVLLVMTYVIIMRAVGQGYHKEEQEERAGAPIHRQVVHDMRRAAFGFRKDMVSGLMSRKPYLMLALTICLVLAAVSSWLGLSAIIGAFLAGMLFSETRQRRQLRRDFEPINAFLVPFFFIIIGASVSSLPGFIGGPDPREWVFDSAGFAIWGIFLLFLVVAVSTKLIGGMLGMTGRGFKRAFRVGTSMVPRGEVGIIVALIAITAGLREDIVTLIVFIAIGTTIVAPPMISWAFRDYRDKDGDGQEDPPEQSGSLPPIEGVTDDSDRPAPTETSNPGEIQAPGDFQRPS